jgi:general L-amino acid transport system substrate-binding protein
MAIAKDPLAPAYRLAVIQAEESGVTQAKLSEMKKSEDPVIRRLLGGQHGLDDDWAVRMIESVGN